MPTNSDTLDIDYPPTREIDIGTDRLRLETVAGVNDHDHDDADPGVYADLDAGTAETLLTAVRWVAAEFGADAAVTVSAMTAGDRARLVDHAETGRVGDAGRGSLTNLTVAACVDDAPWLAGGESLPDRAAVTAALPPEVVDWLEFHADDLNDLSPGN
jgi:hypothetical protein